MEREDFKGGMEAVFNALNNISVRGFQDVCNMAGCMQIILDMKNKLEADGNGERSEE